MITVDNINYIKTMLLSLKHVKDNIKIIDIDQSGKFKKIEYKKVIYEFKYSDTRHHLYSNKGLTTIVVNNCILYNVIGETIVGYNYTSQKYVITVKGKSKDHLIDDKFIIDIDGLDKSLFDWDEEDLFYYSLKGNKT